ncbi:MAG: P-II family nitrogen regulator [Ardenticatenaceae bacterium]|nr:P-II family nitrogen regulator [Ardenticatenaceae bacterium]
MHHMVLFVLDDPDRCTNILDAWEATGVTGITILESTGLGRMRESSIRDDLPLMPSLMNLLRTREEHHRTLFTVVEDEAMVDKLIEATQSVVGALDEPNKGILFVLPVSHVVGIAKQPHQSGK